MSALLPDRAELDRFTATLFRHADPNTFIVLKAYFHDGDESPVFPARGVMLGDPMRGDEIERSAGVAAQAGRPAAFCPPVCTFRDARTARGYWAATKHDVANGVALSADADTAPQRTRAALVALLGPPTLEVASGGHWLDTATGELQDKLHLHWRLTAPTRTPEEHRRLERARRLAAELTGADRTNVPLSHPLRWAGAVHNKGEPRHARIVAETDHEIDIDAALAALEAAWGERPVPEGDARGGEPEAAWDDVAAALAVIPNDERTDWNRWKETAMAVYRATAGGGLGLFETWSAKREDKHDPAACEVAWEQVERSPPDRIGFGSLVHRARQLEPEWVKPSERFDVARYFEPIMPRPPCSRLVWFGDREAVPPPWLVKGLIPQSQTAITAGVYSAGKTFVVGDLAVAVMLGQPFAGHDVERPGAVLWLAAEGANEIDARIRAAAEVRATPELPGLLPFARQALDVPKLTAPEAETEILELVAEFKAGLGERFPGVDLVMIVVDTLGSAAGFVDGNSPSEAQRVMNLLRRVNVATGALLMLVDHFGKAVETGVMGASSKAQSADVVLAVLCDKNTEGDISNRRMAVHKLRAGGGGATVPFRLQAVPVGMVGGTTCVVEWSSPEVAGSASKPKGVSKPTWSGKARLLRDAIVVATIEHGEAKRLPDADDVEVRAADRERVRTTFYARYTADSAEAKRRAFNRMIDAAQADRLIGVREIGGSDWLWLIEPPTERDSGTSGQPP